MTATTERPRVLPATGTPVRRVHQVVRAVDSWTVLRFSVLFYLSLLVVAVVAGTLLWMVAAATGVIHNVERFIKDLFSLDSFHFSGGAIFEGTVLAGAVLVLLGTACNVLMAVVYNLVSDVVGGIEVTVLEEESGRRPVV
jgi:hypothetical protein